MNDIIDNFVNAYKSGSLDNYQTKQEPRSMNNYFNSMDDLEQIPTFSNKPVSSASSSSTKDSTQYSQIN